MVEFAIVFVTVLLVAVAARIAMAPVEPTLEELAAYLPTYEYAPPTGPHVGPFLIMTTREVIKLGDWETET